MQNLVKKELLEITLSIKNIEEMNDFIESILTPDEFDQIAIRWQIVKKILKKEPQRQIAKDLGISISKVSRGSREIKYGNGIFQKLFKRQDENS
ncbi:MAG: YerC/YecD family TrpR-related protein [Candidatus Gracilibacteria bacterium]|jgi:TrpR family trp operon transcriptional repressor|nr:YerC/YecD family TrpR-related protein [Candidatus Gracilibacteria bacterium]